MNICYIGTEFYTIFFGKLQGKDYFGNKYYQHKSKNKRWVIYKGYEEATKTPPEWDAWLRYVVANPPKKSGKKDGNTNHHIPNITGTKYTNTLYKEFESRPKKYSSWKPKVWLTCNKSLI